MVRLWLVAPLDVNTISAIIESHTRRNAGLRTTLINHFDKIEMVSMSNQHTHKKAAQNRTSANLFLNQIAVKAGYEPYNVSRANHDIEGGCRYFYNIKDIGTPYRSDKIHANSAFIFCDVDYYADMPRWLRMFKPTLIYTLVPETVTYRDTDYAYRVLNDEVEYLVSGGATYKHKLWDYSGDILSVVDDNGDLCIYNIEQKKVPTDPNRRLIWLIPLAKVDGPYWRLAFDNPPNLQRRKFQQVEGVNRIYEVVEDRLSIGRNGDWHSVELAGRVYDAIRTRLRNKESKPNVGDVERMLEAAKDPKAAANAPLLFEMLDAGVLVPNVVRTTLAQSNYQPIGPLFTEDAKLSGAVIGNAMTTQPGVFPAKGYNTDVASIDGRITKVSNPVKPAKKYAVWAKEFLELVVPDGGKGVPLEIDEVRQRQTRAAQVARYEMVKEQLVPSVKNRIKSFVKTEPYPATNDPRHITTMSAENTILLSTYSLAFKDHIKRFKWYGPGLSPSQLARRLGDVVRAAPAVSATDYSRMDGTVSEWITKTVLFPIYTRWAAESHRDTLLKLLNGVYCQRGTTAHGLRYALGWIIRSGSSVTTEFGTLTNAFVQYCALRKSGRTPCEAFEALGIMFGDDGVQALYEDNLEALCCEAATELGLILKSVPIEKGNPVPFLGRWFANPSVRTDSFQDPIRTCTKLHLTANKNVSEQQALVNKAAGYWTTDRLTPIIGTWASKVREQYGAVTKSLTPEEQHKCSNAWPQRDRDAIWDAMAKVLGMTVLDLRDLDNMIADCALDQLPVVLENTSTHRMRGVIDDQVVGPVPHNHEPESKGTASSMPSPGGEDCPSHTAAGPESPSETSGTGPQETGPRNGHTRRRHRPGKQASEPTGKYVPGPRAIPGGGRGNRGGKRRGGTGGGRGAGPSGLRTPAATGQP
jgi:hypothetical protein